MIQLYLSVNEAGIKFPESEQLPIVLFGGNFDYDLSEDSQEEKLARLQSAIPPLGKAGLVADRLPR